MRCQYSYCSVRPENSKAEVSGLTLGVRSKTKVGYLYPSIAGRIQTFSHRISHSFSAQLPRLTENMEPPGHPSAGRLSLITVVISIAVTGIFSSSLRIYFSRTSNMPHTARNTISMPPPSDKQGIFLTNVTSRVIVHVQSIPGNVWSQGVSPAVSLYAERENCASFVCPNTVLSCTCVPLQCSMHRNNYQ